jgi:hypothetical protein
MKEQEREKIKAMNLHGKELYEYCIFKSNDIELSQETMMVLYASGDSEKAIKYLERIIYNNETLTYYYPEFMEKNVIKDKELIGTIEDGALYI